MTAVILAGFDAGQTSCRCRLRRAFPFFVFAAGFHPSSAIVFAISVLSLPMGRLIGQE